MDYSEICKQVAPFIGDVKDIYDFKTDSSHSNFAIIYDLNYKKYICKEIYDTTLSGTKDCVRYEFMALKIANSLGIAPRPIMYNEQLCVIVSEYIQADKSGDISLKGVIDRAKYAKIFSAAKYNENDFLKKHDSFEMDFKEHMRLLNEAITYANEFEISSSKSILKTPLLDEKNIILSQEILNFRSELVDVYEICLTMNDELLKLPPVLSHNDLVADNILTLKSGRKYMIDFETVGISKEDFIIGQLAVDAEIDWSVNQKRGESIDILYNRLNAVFNNVVDYKLFLARVLERYTQNICYGYRQVAIGYLRNYPTEYMNLKRQVINFCKEKLNFIMERLKHEY